MLPHVFDLFRQAGESPNDARGMGVGLSLFHRIVTLHGGRIDVHSAGVNRGSAFIVTIRRQRMSIWSPSRAWVALKTVDARRTRASINM